MTVEEFIAKREELLHRCVSMLPRETVVFYGQRGSDELEGVLILAMPNKANRDVFQVERIFFGFPNGCSYRRFNSIDVLHNWQSWVTNLNAGQMSATSEIFFDHSSGDFFLSEDLKSAFITKVELVAPQNLVNTYIQLTDVIAQMNLLKEQVEEIQQKLNELEQLRDELNESR